MKRVLTIKADYCKEWTIKEALREIIQNALDTKTPVHFEPENNTWNIRDEGAGIILTDFLIGQTSKATDSTVIGQFGEGLKLACLVLARESRKISVSAKGKQYTFAFEYSKQWNSKLLTLESTRIPLTSGTMVSVECTDDELQEAKDLFRAFLPNIIEKDGKDSKILTNCAGQIYVNGLLVSEIEAIFGYDFIGQKELVNRDRNAINSSQISQAIKNTWEGVKDVGIISKFLDCAIHPDFRACIECGMDWSLRDTAEVWRQVVRSKWGTMICLVSDHPKINQLAEECNYKVITVGWSTKWMLDYYGIIQKADKVIESKPKRSVAIEDLSEEQASIFKQGKQLANRIAQLATLRTFPVHIYVDEQAEQGTKQYGERGYFDPKAERVGIEISMLNDPANVARTLLHEFVHGTFQHEDASRELESDCFSIISKLGIRILELTKED